MFTPYLTFDGTCAEAMEFYAAAFGARDLQILRYAEGPAAVGSPDRARVMHARFSHRGGVLMACDVPADAPYHAQQSVSLFVPEEDPDAGRALLEQLSQGGALLMPYERTGWSPGLGICRDRFGTTWMIGATDPATGRDLP